MKLINIGFGNLVSAGRVVAVVMPSRSPDAMWRKPPPST